VVQQLSQGGGGPVGAPRVVAEPVDEVAREAPAGWIVELAAALVGQYQQGGGRHHLGDAGDPEGHLGVQAATVAAVGGRGRGPAFGVAGVSTRSRHRWTPGGSRPAAVSATTPSSAAVQPTPSAAALLMGSFDGVFHRDGETS
jgi:hypothetical protein